MERATALDFPVTAPYLKLGAVQREDGKALTGCGKSRSVLFSEQSVPLSVAVTH